MDQKEIGAKIRYFRINKLNISQEDFSKRIGLDRTYVCKVESGQKNLTLETLNKFCDGLGITLKDLINFEIPNGEV